MEVLHRNFKLAEAPNIKSTRWETKEPQLGEVIRLFCNPEEFNTYEDKKDCPMYMPGELDGHRRVAPSVRRLYFLIADLDRGQTYDEAKAIMEAAPFVSLLHTSYSHGNTETLLPVKKLVNFCQIHGIDTEGKAPHHIDGVMEQYIEKQFEGCHNWTVERATVDKHDGSYIHIKHDPLEKLRVILPLDMAVVIEDLGDDQKERAKEWRRLYLSALTQLGLKFDKACSDLPRAFAFPAFNPKNPDALRCDFFLDEARRFYDIITDCTPMSDDELGLKEESSHASGTLVRSEEGKHMCSLPNGVTFDVGHWCTKNLQFAGEPLYALLQEVYPDAIRGEESAQKWDEGFRHIKCPFEYLHTEEGGTGTFLYIPQADDEWTRIRCLHDHCKGNSTEDFLLQMLQDGWLTPNHLLVVQRVAAMIKAGHSPNVRETVYSLLHEKSSANLPVLDEVGEYETTDRNIVLEQIDEAKRVIIETDDQEVIDYLEGCETAQAYEQFWKELAPKLDIPRTAENDIVYLALSALTHTPLKEYYRVHMRRLAVTQGDVEAQVRDIRGESMDVELAFGDIWQTGLRNQALNNRIKYWAERYLISTSELMSQYTAYAARQNHSAEDDVRKRAEEINAQYGKIVESGSTKFIDVAQFKEDGTVRILSKEGLRDLHSNEMFEVIYGEKTKPVPWNAVDYWLKKIVNHRTYEGRVFDPSYIGPDGGPGFNLYRGLHAVEPVPGDISMFRDHVLNVWCDGDEKLCNWVFTWFAQIVQQPWKRYPTAIMLIGQQGTGKSLPIEHGFAKCLQPYVFVATQREEVSGHFNAHMAEKLLFVGEEAVFKGDHKTMDTLKAYISSGNIGVTRKGHDTQQQEPHLRFFFSSNHEDALNLEKNDRRFLVLRTTNAHMQDVEYFEKMIAFLENGGVNHLMYTLKTWNPAAVGMSWNDLHRAPMTDAKKFQIEQSVTVPQSFWMDLIVNGSLSGFSDDVDIPNVMWPLDQELYVPMHELQQLYYFFISRNGNKKHDKAKLRMSFDEMLGTKIGDATHMHSPIANMTPVRCVKLPPRRGVVERNQNMMTESQYNEALGYTNDPADVTDLNDIREGDQSSEIA